MNQAENVYFSDIHIRTDTLIVPALVFPIYFSLKYLLVAGVVVVELHWWLSSKKKMGRRKTVKIHKVFIATKLARNEVLLKNENEI